MGRERILFVGGIETVHLQYVSGLISGVSLHLRDVDSVFSDLYLLQDDVDTSVRLQRGCFCSLVEKQLHKSSPRSIVSHLIGQEKGELVSQERFVRIRAVKDPVGFLGHSQYRHSYLASPPSPKLETVLFLWEELTRGMTSNLDTDQALENKVICIGTGAAILSLLDADSGRYFGLVEYLGSLGIDHDDGQIRAEICRYGTFR